MIELALLSAILDDPRPGLLITGDSLLRERMWRELGAILADRGHRVRLVPSGTAVGDLAELSGISRGPERIEGSAVPPSGGVTMIAAAEQVEPELAARLAREPALIMTGPTLSAVPPALARRCCAVVDLPAGVVPLRQLLSGPLLAPVRAGRPQISTTEIGATEMGPTETGSRRW